MRISKFTSRISNERFLGQGEDNEKAALTRRENNKGRTSSIFASYVTRFTGSIDIDTEKVRARVAPRNSRVARDSRRKERGESEVCA